MSLSRRQILPAAFTIVPRSALGGPGYIAPSDKLVLAAAGVGGMGAEYLKGCESQTVGALCDVDTLFAARIFRKYPQAKTYTDFRVMLEREKAIDAVIIGTPDHTHAAVASTAMKLGKHVYCAKPMTRTVHEARALARLAREQKLATQMSVQSCASDEACTAEEWLRAGAIGAVREIHIWTDRPVWPQGVKRPADTPPLPQGLAWDLWLGPAPVRPWNPAYHPFVWRGWTDFGTGALGDMACHAFHVPFRALGLRHPLSVHASTSRVVESSLELVDGEPRLQPRISKLTETFPHAAIISWDFPGGVRLTWYEGGIRPPRPFGLEPGKQLAGSGQYYVGDKGVMLSGFTGGPRVLGREFPAPPRTVARTMGHYEEWINACKGGPPANCNFEFASLITETALLGVIAERVPGGLLEWDPAAMRFPNSTDATALLNPPARAGWSIE